MDNVACQNCSSPKIFHKTKLLDCQCNNRYLTYEINQETLRSVSLHGVKSSFGSYDFLYKDILYLGKIQRKILVVE